MTTLAEVYSLAVEALDNYQKALIKSLPRNPKNSTQLCQLDTAMVYLERAQVQSKVKPPKSEKR